jgi:hypothetical protein
MLSLFVTLAVTACGFLCFGIFCVGLAAILLKLLR